jgi:hypothetical protein
MKKQFTKEEILKENKQPQAGRVAQVVVCLPSKREALNSNSSATK